jgi:hypothetical protein
VKYSHLFSGIFNLSQRDNEIAILILSVLKTTIRFKAIFSCINNNNIIRLNQPEFRRLVIID